MKKEFSYPMIEVNFFSTEDKIVMSGLAGKMSGKITSGGDVSLDGKNNINSANLFSLEW